MTFASIAHSNIFLQSLERSQGFLGNQLEIQTISSNRRYLSGKVPAASYSPLCTAEPKEEHFCVVFFYNIIYFYIFYIYRNE